MKESSGGKKQGGGSGGASPCAACKLLRRRCAQDCVFAPYFPADEPHKFASVHKVFGASNVNKMLQELPEEQRGDAVSSMVYEANARVRDPVYGCVGAISSLQQQIDVLQAQLAVARAEVVHMKMRHFSTATPTSSSSISNNRTCNSSGEELYGGSRSSCPSTTQRSLFSMDMSGGGGGGGGLVDQSAPNLAESLWSC